MSATVYVSTQTEVYFVNTNAQSGTIILPSTTTNTGYFLTFKDIVGNLGQSTITFQTVNPSQTFEDGSLTKTFNDTFGSYTFTADASKWYLVGGSRMDTAVISTLTTNQISQAFLSTGQLLTSSIQFASGASLYSESSSLYYGTNAWGGAKTATPFYTPALSYSVTGIASATGGIMTTTQVGSTTFNVHTFISQSGLNTAQTFTVLTPGMFEMILIGGGGNGAFFNDVYNRGGGGGGGGEVIDYTNNPIFLGAGTYEVYVPSNNVSSTVFTGTGVNIVARNGTSGGSANGGTSGSGLYTGSGNRGGLQDGGGGGAGAGGNGSLPGGTNNWSGGAGGIGQAIVDYTSGTQSTFYVCGGGGGGAGYSGSGGLGGLGGGGRGASANVSLRNGSAFGAGGGGCQNGASGVPTANGTGAPGVVYIRYTYFSTMYR